MPPRQDTITPSQTNPRPPVPSEPPAIMVDVSDDEAEEELIDILVNDDNIVTAWTPTGVWWRDFLFFVGPGFFISIAYVDPGNYQADIQAGASTRYYLLFCIWWTSVLSVYVQILCVRLAYYGQVTLAEAQARDSTSDRMRYLNWFIAEFSIIITDLPEVIGIGIAMNIFFGWPYYAGVLLSLLTTMFFLATLNFGIRTLEIIVFMFVGIMSVSLFVEMSFVGVDGGELMAGWIYGFKDVTSKDVFSITGILGAIVMPHNIYLHSTCGMNRKVKRDVDTVKAAVKYGSYEPVLPILFSFFVNMAVVAIAAERVYGSVEDADRVGLTDFCDYFKNVKGGCIMFGIALLAAGQSSAITTTFTGQYVMDGFLKIQLPTSLRAIVTRLVAITPCVIVSVMFPHKLNLLVNLVNSSLAFLLPFAFTPLVKYNCSEEYMGQFAAGRTEKRILYSFCFLVYAINAVALSIPGGGLLGDARQKMDMSFAKVLVIFLEIFLQGFYAWWNYHCLASPIKAPMTPFDQQRPADEHFPHAIT
mmetsp:Transcript_17509/g.25934  ORF Transcript_17509/g.25934 Transcript_17509/m.25934 type:complete len:530 (-) Transcript_17509:90-1679(-)